MRKRYGSSSEKGSCKDPREDFAVSVQSGQCLSVDIILNAPSDIFEILQNNAAIWLKFSTAHVRCTWCDYLGWMLSGLRRHVEFMRVPHVPAFAISVCPCRVRRRK